MAGLALSACPVCPFAALAAHDLACPSCGTDLTVLRRVQELPLVLLGDAIRLARAGDLPGARRRCEAAGTFAVTRPAALRLLARYELRAGHVRAGLRAWRAATAEARGDGEGATLAAAVVRPPVWRRRR